MKREVKLKWVEALRSGQYQQGKKMLHSLRDDTYCCLGVLSDLAVKEGVVSPSPSSIHTREIYREVYDSCYVEYLCPKVMEWAGLRKANPWITGVGTLSHMNDVLEMPFEVIALYIEKDIPEED